MPNVPEENQTKDFPNSRRKLVSVVSSLIALDFVVSRTIQILKYGLLSRQYFDVAFVLSNHILLGPRP